MLGRSPHTEGGKGRSIRLLALRGRIDSVRTTLSLRNANANSTAVLRDKLDSRLPKSGYDSLSGFGSPPNLSLGRFQSLNGRGRYP